MSEMETAGLTKHLLVRKESGIGYLGLNQPEKHNAITFEMWQGIAQALDDFEADEKIRVIVVAGEGGRAFSAGADISQFEQKRSTAGGIEVYNEAMGSASQKLNAVSKPTIAKITGYCIGGGVATALCCDLRIASEDSQFGIPAARLGLGYGLGGLRSLVDLVGPSRAKEIMFTAKRFSAEEAYDMGLLNRVLPREELDEFVNDYAETIAENAPLTIKASKQIISEFSKDFDERDFELCKRLVNECYESDDYKEGRKAFMEKRNPAFTGR